MAYKTLLSRELPIPPLNIGRQPIEVRVYERGSHENDKKNKNVQVYCTIALDKADAAPMQNLRVWGNGLQQNLLSLWGKVCTARSSVFSDSAR